MWPKVCKYFIQRSLPVPVLGIFGGADNSITVEDVHAFDAALDQAGVPNEISLYDGQPHAFLPEMDTIRSGVVQGQAWAQMLEFFEKALKQGSASQSPVSHLAYAQPFDLQAYPRAPEMPATC